MAEAHKRSRAQEDRVAGVYKGSRNAMSGAGWVRKGDVRSDDFLIEAKVRLKHENYTLKLKELRELRKQAIMDDRIPLFTIEMSGHNYVVLDENDFVALTGLDQ